MTRLYYSSPPGILIKGLTIALLLCLVGSGSQNPQNVFSNITYSWMRHADIDNKNVKKAGRQQHVNASCFMHLNGFIFLCTFKIKK